MGQRLEVRRTEVGFGEVFCEVEQCGIVALEVSWILVVFLILCWCTRGWPRWICVFVFMICFFVLVSLNLSHILYYAL